MTDTKKNANKSGVALIIVVGLMSVILISAVAFSISMRIERQGSFNYRNGVQARHILWAGLGEAINDINNLVTNSVFPEWQVTNSSSIGAYSKAGVLTHSLTNYLSKTMLDSLKTLTPAWHNIWVPSGSGAATAQVGRCAYIIINQSGLLDANYVGGLLSRGGGTNVAEVQLSPLLLPEIGIVSTFTNDRATHVRYESIAEMVRLNAGLNAGVWPDNMCTFSLALANDELVPPYVSSAFGVTLTNKVYIGCDYNTLKNPTKVKEVKAAFEASGVSDPTQAYLSLLDYVGSNSVPENLAAGCGKAVPMIYEVRCKYDITFNGVAVTKADLFPYCKIIYPFKKSPSQIYNLHYQVTVKPESKNVFSGALPVVAPSGEQTKMNVSMPSGGTDARKISLVSLSAANGTGGAYATNQLPVNFSVNISAFIVGADGNRVDEVPSPYNPTANGVNILFDFSCPSNAAATMSVTNWAECADPRYNWDTAMGTGFWYDSVKQVKILMPAIVSPSAGTNNITTFLFNPLAYSKPVYDADYDDDLLMYCANRPLGCVGELGYLGYKKLTTIRLYDHKATKPEVVSGKKIYYHKIYDYFTMCTNSYERGMVNVNTTNINVLASVFLETPFEEYSPTTRLSDLVKVKSLATEIYNNGPYTNLSDLGKLSLWTNYTGSTEIEKESLIRNTADMLTTRDNLFTIIIAADSCTAGAFGGTVGEQVLASARAIAEVWRDPIKDKNDRNRMVIRQFKILEN